LDDYQRINRALGYDAGDTLLRETAQRLKALVTPNEQLARVASDKFAVVLGAPDRTQASNAADALARRLQAAVREPYVYQGQTVHLSA
ncbi:diguanylate cyclase, partial [Mycobacterium tuberculosis]|nr:diguanylate cyclase [Mycobacterium tuberculosis]